jgi:hypothetical protein
MEYNRHEELLEGVHRGAWFGQNDRIDELNERIYSRNISDIPLAPNFDPRPLSTKQSLFPIINQRKEATEQIIPAIHRESLIHFAPCNRTNVNANGYFSNIDLETKLRNQKTILQHGASEGGVYIPSSKSDLYNAPSPIGLGRAEHQPFSDLFQSNKFSTHIPDNLSSIGKNSFFNHTRNQLKDM